MEGDVLYITHCGLSRRNSCSYDPKFPSGHKLVIEGEGLGIAKHIFNSPDEQSSHSMAVIKSPMTYILAPVIPPASDLGNSAHQGMFIFYL